MTSSSTWTGARRVLMPPDNSDATGVLRKLQRLYSARTHLSSYAMRTFFSMLNTVRVGLLGSNAMWTYNRYYYNQAGYFSVNTEFCSRPELSVPRLNYTFLFT